MATKKKPATKVKKPDPKKPQTKPLLNVTNLKTNIRSSFKKNRSFYIIWLVIVLILIGTVSLFWFNKGLFLAGTIDGKIVTTPEFYSKLTKANGKEVFDSIVRETLIKQEATKKGISVTEEESDEKIKELEDRLGGKENLELALKQNNTNIEEVRQQIAIQILVEKMFEDEVKVSDKEVSKYIKENKQFSPNLSKEEATKAIKSTKINDKFTVWFEDLKSKANITTYF